MAMNDEGQALSTLGEPLTGVVQPAATPSAVDQLVDAYHKGFITTNDILAHSGALAAAQGQNALDVLKIQPDIIAAQKSQANLSTAQSQAQLAAVQPLAKLQQTQIEKQTADVNDKAAEDAADAAGIVNSYTSDGTIDRVAKRAAGNQILQGQKNIALGQAMLAGAQQTTMYDEKTDSWRNVLWSPTFGNVTPPIGDSPGSDAWQTANDLITSGIKSVTDPRLGKRSGVPGHLQPAAPAVAPPPAAVAPVAPVVTPAAPASNPAAVAAGVAAATAPVSSIVPIAQGVPGLPSAATADLGGFVQPAAQPATTTITHPDGTTIQQTTPPPATAAAVQPAAPTPGMASWPLAPRFDVAQKIMSDARAQVFYQNWANKASAIGRMRAIASTPATGTTTQDDHDLAISVAQLVSPSTSIRGGGDVGQIKSIEDAVPVLEKVMHLKAAILKTEAYPPEVRKRLIAVGERAAKPLEDGARSSLQGTISNLRMMASLPRGSISQQFNPVELDLLQRGGGTAQGAPQGGTIISLPNGRNVVVGPRSKQ